MYTTEPLKVPQRVLGFSGTLFEGSRARVSHTGQLRTLLAPFVLRVYVVTSQKEKDRDRPL